MKRSDYYKALEAYKMVLAKQDIAKEGKSRGSTGSTGKLLDVLVRDYILVKGIQSVSDVKCRKLGKVDVLRKSIGKVEIKSGSGAVAYGENLTKDDCIEENVLPGVDLVTWTPFTGDYIDEGNFFYMTWVFTREQFIDTLKAIGKHGLASSLKVSKQGRQINIQTITPRMEDRLWDILENIPTLEEYFK